MRIFPALFFFVAVICSADEGETSVKVLERDRDKDGTPDFRIETTYRGKTPIMRVLRTTKGRVTTTGRSFFAGGELVMPESDDDGDGFFETLAIYKPDSEEMEVFTRERNGTVRPVDSKTLAAFITQSAAISEFFDKMFEGEGHDMEKLMIEAKEKIQKAEQEKGKK